MFIGKKGKSNCRWIVGGKRCLLLYHRGRVVDWACDTANVYDGSAFIHLVETFRHDYVIFADTGFTKVDWRPTNLRLCQQGEWNVRMVVETVLSMLAYVYQFKLMGRISLILIRDPPRLHSVLFKQLDSVAWLFT